ncbi:hypothetical protein HELRODRAFT_168651 [Helobdella robusta]|uniref:Uncharacterized protein n=1 Tax=Helobdella robusta TaxID=6412 RepID=T1F0U2_HELRO|nr:hypothetical protein HELRODRAFT_168651 [Helobdella robusta]ESO08739.1 hypothetical protein HELRODRAFT_168651 [Helobdella robusta]
MLKVQFQQTLTTTINFSSNIKNTNRTSVSINILYPEDLADISVKLFEKEKQPVKKSIITENEHKLSSTEFKSKIPFKKLLFNYGIGMSNSGFNSKTLNRKSEFVYANDVTNTDPSTGRSDYESTGYSVMEKTNKQSFTDEIIYTWNITLVVTPPPSKFGLFPMFGMFVGFAVNIFGFSLTLKRSDAMPFLKKPVELGIIACGQYLLLPAMAFLLNIILSPNAAFQFIFISMSSASSGAFSNISTILIKARLNLNILALLLMPILGIVMIPAWICTAGSYILKRAFQDYQFYFPWKEFLILKSLYIIPGLIGMTINKYFPKVAAILTVVIRAIGFVWVVSMTILMLIDQTWVLAYGRIWNSVLGPVILPIIGGLTIFTISYLSVRDIKTSATIVVQVITPNPSYGVLLSLLMVSPPYNAICICISILYFCTILAILITSTVFVRTRQRIVSRRKQLSRIEYPTIDISTDSSSASECANSDTDIVGKESGDTNKYRQIKKSRMKIKDILNYLKFKNTTSVVATTNSTTNSNTTTTSTNNNDNNVNNNNNNNNDSTSNDIWSIDIPSSHSKPDELDENNNNV